MGTPKSSFVGLAAAVLTLAPAFFLGFPAACLVDAVDLFSGFLSSTLHRIPWILPYD